MRSPQRNRCDGDPLNGWNDSYPELHEAGLAKRKEAFYYGFNVSTEQGYETTRALLSFMAERYSGAHDDYGRVSNWIVGNEINNNLNWNYTGPMDIDSYTKLYSKVFRVPTRQSRARAATREYSSPQTMSGSGRTPI